MTDIIFRDREEALVTKGYSLVFRAGFGVGTEVLVQEPDTGDSPFWVELEGGDDTRTLIPTLLRGDEEWLRELIAANELIGAIVWTATADDALVLGENGDYVAWTPLLEADAYSRHYSSKHPSPRSAATSEESVPSWHYYCLHGTVDRGKIPAASGRFACCRRYN